MRGAWWGWRAAGSARAQLQAGIAEDCRLAPATATGPGADRGVRIALRLRRATCLESALVRRAAVAAHGTARDLVIGVARDGGGYVAHAWLEGDGVDPRYTELTRWPVR